MESVAIKFPGCRTDTAAFFSQSGYFSKGARWAQRPLLVLLVTADGLEVQILNSASQVIQSTLPDSAPCMQQWAGQWRSDFFTFTLGEARAALARQ